MLCDVIRIPLRRYIAVVIKTRGSKETIDVIREVAHQNEDLDMDSLGVLLSKLPTVKRVELTDWSRNGIIVERERHAV